MVQLTHTIVPPTHQGPDLSGVRVERDHRDLGLVGVRRGLVFSSPQLSDVAVHLLHSCLDSLRGALLQLEIECGVDAEALGKQIALGDLSQQLVFHHVHKERRLTPLQVLSCHL